MKGKRILVTLTSMVGLTLASPSAVAEVTATPDSHGSLRQHCAVNVKTGAKACADDAVAAQRLVGRTASIDLVKFYDGANFKGYSLTYYGDTPCTPTYGDIDFVDESFDDPFWNNRISSVKTYNRCDVKLYDGTHLTGASSVWIDAAADLAQIGTGWSNRASSFKAS